MKKDGENREKKARERRNLKRKQGEYLVKIFCVAIVVYIVFFFATQFIRIRTLKQEEAQLNLYLEMLNSEKQQLEEELEVVNSAEYIEKKAREELKMVKPNEKLYVDLNKEREEKNR